MDDVDDVLGLDKHDNPAMKLKTYIRSYSSVCWRGEQGGNKS